MELKLDLHIHSAHSPDGCMPVEEIVSRCRAAGLHGAAVCDHDRVLADTPSFDDFLLIPGVEISTEHGHLLGLFVTAPIETRSFREAAETIRAQGGITVLAHPFEHSADPARLAPLVPLLDGVEVWNSRAERKNPHANAQALAFAQQHGLRPFGGSDAHVPQEIGNAAVTVETPSADPDAVKAALHSGAVAVTGRRSPARWTARSQLIKRKKAGASPLSYLKWALFALKCCALDFTSKGE